MTAKVMPGGHRTELVRREIASSVKKSKIIRRHHVMQTGFLGTDRAITQARASQVRSDLEPHSPAVAAPRVGSSRHIAILGGIIIGCRRLQTQMVFFHQFDNLKEYQPP